MTWVDIPTPVMGERPGNNGNIIAIDHHYPSTFSNLDSGLILTWEKPYYPVVTNNEGNSYTSLYSVDSAFCYANGFSVLDDTSSGYTQLVMYGMGCSGGGMFSRYLDGPFPTFQVDSSYNTVPGAFTDIDSDNSQNSLIGHDDGNLFSYQFITGKDTILLDTTGVDALAYAGNQTWYASTSRNTTYHMYKSTDNGLSFQVDSSFIPTFFYPKFRDMDFLDNGLGICGGQSSGANGSISIKNNQGWYLYPTDHPINAVKLFVDETAYAVGDSGLVMKTTKITSGIKREREQKTKLIIYPNPVSERISLKLRGEGTVNEINLFNIHGKKVKSFSSDSRTLDVSGLSAGGYILRIFMAEELITEKVLIQ